MTGRSSIVGLALVGALVSACAASAAQPPNAPEAAASEESAAPLTLRLGYFPNVTHAPAIIGVDSGLFADALGANTTLETSTFNSGTEVVEALFSGAIEEAGSSSRLVRLPEKPAMTALALLHRLGVSPLGPYHSRLISGTFVFDTTRIKEDLGWRPTRTNEEMLREAYRFYAANEAERSEDLSAHRQGAKMGILRLVKWLS